MLDATSHAHNMAYVTILYCVCGNDTSDTHAPAFSNISATLVQASMVSGEVPGAWYSRGIPKLYQLGSLILVSTKP